jgi:uncharacterized MnhB-related membrane protein
MWSMWYIIIVVGILVCAVMAIRTKRLLVSALWLAGNSALVALLIYLLGAPEIAVIELSVGAGLVTVLFVFAINIAGEEPEPIVTLIPKPLAWVLVMLAVLLLAWLSLPALNNIPLPAASGTTSFSLLVWRDRAVDVLLQIVLIFAGVLGVLGLMAEHQSHPRQGKNS